MTNVSPADRLRERRRKYRRFISKCCCDRARTPAAWRIADRMAKSFDLPGCEELGFPALPEEIPFYAQRRQQP